jgi:hypothetical protein
LTGLILVVSIEPCPESQPASFQIKTPKDDACAIRLRAPLRRAPSDLGTPPEEKVRNLTRPFLRHPTTHLDPSALPGRTPDIARVVPSSASTKLALASAIHKGTQVGFARHVFKQPARSVCRLAHGR